MATKREGNQSSAARGRQKTGEGTASCTSVVAYRTKEAPHFVACASRVVALLEKGLVAINANDPFVLIVDVISYLDS